MQYKELSRKLEKRSELLVESTMQCIYKDKRDDIKETEREKKSINDLKYILNYLSEAVYFNKKEIFNDFSDWLKTLFINIGLGEQVFTDTYNCLQKVIFSEFNQEISNYLIRIIEDAKNSAIEKQEWGKSYIKEDNPYYEYAKQYLKLLLDHKKSQASKLITEEAFSNMEVDEIYLKIFQPVQKEVGRLWHKNEVSVAQEHYISSVTQLIMSQLYAHFLSIGGKKGSLVTTAVGNELHEIGIRMIADLFEVDGYDTIHLGANTPNNSIIETLRNNHSKLLGISVTLPIHLQELEKLINMIKNAEGLQELKIMVGGYAFNRNPSLLDKFDIDLYCKDASEAVNKANELMKGVN